MKIKQLVVAPVPTMGAFGPLQDLGYGDAGDGHR
jgi:hypothetical protein